MPRILLVAVCLAVTAAASGCLVRTTRPAYRVDGTHRHEHCHDRGGKHHKQVCHSHPHDGAHH